MNSKLAMIGESVTLQIADIARELKRRGNRVIELQTGDPDFATPATIVDAAYRAMSAGQTHYGDTRGLPRLRQAIAGKLFRENSLEYDPQSEILVTHGGVHAVYIAINSLIEPSDEVLITDPCWMPYVSSTIIAGGRPVRIPTDPGKGFLIDTDRIETHISPRSRVLIVNSPCNPTGRVLSRRQLQEIANIANQYDLFVISDEVYEKQLYDGRQHLSIASLPGMKERTVTINSFSKTYAMTGWRIGYVAAPPEIVQQMLKVSQYSITNVALYTQEAAVTALTDIDVQAFVETMRNAYDRRRRQVLEALNKIEGVQTVVPEGAFYCMIGLPRICRDSVEFARRFLQQEFVSVVPGVGFGQCAEGCIRVSFTTAEEQLLEGIARLDRMLHRYAMP